MLRQRRSTRPTKKRISWSLSPGPPELEHKVTTASKKESQKERGIDTLPSHDLTDACLRRNQRASRLGNGRGVAEGRESGKEGTKMRTVQSELHPSLHRSSNVCSSNGHKKQAHEQKALQQMMSEGKRSGGQILAESCADGDVCDNGKKKRKASSEEKGLLEKLSTRAKLPGVPVPASFISSGDECIQVAAVMGKRQHSTVAQSLRTSNDEHVSGMRKGNSEDTEQHNLVPRGIAERCFGVGSVVDASAASNTRSSNRTHMDGSNAIPEAERVGILPGTCRDAEVNMRLAGPDSHLGGQEDHNGLTTPPGQGNEQQEEPTVSVPQLLGHPGVEARSSSPLTLEGEPHGQLTECSSPRAICHAQVPLRTEEGEVEVVHDSLKTPPPVCDMDNFCGGSACTTSARRTPQLTQKRLQHLATETLRRLQQRQRTEHKAKVQDASCQATPRARQFEEAYTAFEERKKRRPCWQEVPLAGVHPKALIGRRCKIYWPLDKDWYPGVIYSYNHHNNKHRVDYADDENEWLLLSRERVQLSMRPGEMLPRLGREGVAGDPAAAGGDADADVDTDTDTAQQQQGLGLRKRGCDGGGGGGGGAYTAASDGGIIRGAGNNNNNNCGRARARTSGGGGGSSSRSISLRRSPELEVGSVVWGKVKGFPAWPAVVLAEEDCNQIVMESGPQQGIPVQFFGSFDFCRFRLKQLTPFMKGVKQQRLHTKCSKLVFLEGLQQARRYMQYQELPLAMQATRRDDDDDDDDESVAADGGDGNTGTPPTAQGDEENYDNDNSPPVVSSSYRPVTVDYGDKCRVCFLVDEWPDNLLLQCDRCHVMAHMHCCGEESSPDGDLWLCNLCRPGAPKHTPICCLCPVAGGVLKKTTDGRWAHNTCTMWIPDVYHVDDQHVSVESVPKERRDLLCSICKVDYGACIQCAYKRCFVAYHPLCAMNRGYVMEFEERRVETKSKSGQAKAKARQQERQQHQNNNNNNNKEEEEEEGREAAAACVVAEEEQEQEGRRTRRSRRVRGSEEGERAQQHHPGERQALKELPPDRVAAGEGGGAKRLLLLSDKEKKTRKNKRKREEEAVAVEMDTAAATATAYAGPTHSNGHVHGKAGEEEEEEAATATATARAPDAQQQGPGAEPEEGTPAAATAVEYIWNSWCSKHKPARKAGLAALSPRGNSTNNNNDDDDIARKKKKSAGSSAKGEAERGGGGGTQGEHPSSSSLQRTGLLGAEGAVATDGVGGRERGNSCLISYQPPETNPYSGCARSEPYKWLRRGRKEPEAVAAGLAKRNFVENVPYVVGGMGGGGGRTSKHRPQSYDPNASGQHNVSQSSIPPFTISSFPALAFLL